MLEALIAVGLLTSLFAPGLVSMLQPDASDPGVDPEIPNAAAKDLVADIALTEPDAFSDGLPDIDAPIAQRVELDAGQVSLPDFDPSADRLVLAMDEASDELELDFTGDGAPRVGYATAAGHVSVAFPGLSAVPVAAMAVEVAGEVGAPIPLATLFEGDAPTVADAGWAQAEQVPEVTEFRPGEHLLHVALDPASVGDAFDVEVAPSADGADSLVRVNGQVVAVVRDTPDVTPADLQVERGAPEAFDPA